MKNKKQALSKVTYIILSVGIATVLIFTALPYYTLSTLAYPKWNRYTNYSDVQKTFMILFPILSLLGALTTIKKKVTIEDIFLNVTFPLTILLALRALQYAPLFTIGGIWLSLIWTVLIMREYWLETRKKRTFKRIRIAYYAGRKYFIYMLLIMFTPTVVWANYQENEADEKIFFETTVEENTASLQSQGLELSLVSEEEWKTFTLGERHDVVCDLVNYECSKLGVDTVNVYSLKEITDSRIAFYSNAENAIYYNGIEMANCDLEEAIHTVCHEVYHKNQQVIVDSLSVLEEAGVAYQNLNYYAEAVALQEATKNYNIDAKSYETYSKNLLEVQAEAYAEEEIKWMEQEGYLK